MGVRKCCIGALALAVLNGWTQGQARRVAAASAGLSLLALVFAWLGFNPDGPLFQHIDEVSWVPSLGVAYRVGADGIALAVATMSAVLFVAAILYPVETRGQPRQYYAWLLFLQGAALGVFLTLDLLLFYVFFDLTLVDLENAGDHLVNACFDVVPVHPVSLSTST